MTPDDVVTNEPLPFDLVALEAEARAAIEAAETTEELAQAEAAALGKRSPFTAAQRALGQLAPASRSAAGEALNGARTRLRTLVADRQVTLAAAERAARLEADRLDLTEVLRGRTAPPLRRGRAHLVAQTRQALEEVFVGMGFVVAEGPEAESDWYNFEALNMPPAHPARGMYDTFYLDLGAPETIVLRSHTSRSRST